jgi:hypothetical protein
VFLCYTFTAVTRLVVYALLIFAVQGQPERPKPSSNKTHPQGSSNPMPHTPSTASAGRAVVVDQQAPQAQESRPTNQPQSYLKRLLAAENLPSLILSLIGIVGVIVAICTLGSINQQAREMRHQRILMRGQLGAMRRQTRHMEQQLHIEQRAWVGAWGQIVARTEDYIEYKATTKNTGPTPAINVVFEARCVFKDRNYLVAEDFAVDRVHFLNPLRIGKESCFTVLPNDTNTTSVFRFPINPLPQLAMSKEIQEAVAKGSVWFYVGGKVVYEDIFGEQHETEFWQRVEGNLLSWTNLGNTMT